ncbi:MAG: hypothetical protein U0350_28195 [Caldilineaceae bacterium]
MATMIDVSFPLREEVVRKLHEQARRWGMSEASLVERALGLLFKLEDASAASDYWLSVESMREDWDAMPEDWFVNEGSTDVSAR